MRNRTTDSKDQPKKAADYRPRILHGKWRVECDLEVCEMAINRTFSRADYKKGLIQSGFAEKFLGWFIRRLEQKKKPDGSRVVILTRCRWDSIPHLMRVFGVTKDTVCAAMTKLRELGIMTKYHQGQTMRYYGLSPRFIRWIIHYGKVASFFRDDTAFYPVKPGRPIGHYAVVYSRHLKLFDWDHIDTFWSTDRYDSDQLEPKPLVTTVLRIDQLAPKQPVNLVVGTSPTGQVDQLGPSLPLGNNSGHADANQLGPSPLVELTRRDLSIRPVGRVPTGSYSMSSSKEEEEGEEPPPPPLHDSGEAGEGRAGATAQDAVPPSTAASTSSVQAKQSHGKVVHLQPPVKHASGMDGAHIEQHPLMPPRIKAPVAARLDLDADNRTASFRSQKASVMQLLGSQDELRTIYGRTKDHVYVAVERVIAAGAYEEAYKFLADILDQTSMDSIYRVVVSNRTSVTWKTIVDHLTKIAQKKMTPERRGQ